MKIETVSRDPYEEYTRRLEARRAVFERFERLHLTLGNVRLAVTGVAALGAWLAFAHDLFSPWWLAAPGALFIALGVVHERVLRARRRADRAARFYERGLGRIQDRWTGKGETGDRFADDAHPYARDLDLFGKGGLFELICTARTRAAEETLARWLLVPAAVDEVRARHAAIEELRFRLGLREDLALLGEEVRTGVEAEWLPRWAEKPPLLRSRVWRIVACALAINAAASFAGWAVLGLPFRLFLVVVALEAVLALVFRRPVLHVIQAVEKPAHDLALLAEVLVRLEHERFTSPRLVGLRKALDTRGLPPSRRIGYLNRLVELLDSRDNVAVRLIGPPLMWTTQLAFAIEAWRRTTGPSVRRWLTAVGELGALSSLACYAYEHPDDPFPEFLEGEPCFHGEDIGHPLIPHSRSVSNDVRLDRELNVLIVSGSNMSGKSTLLRTVGTNIVLAMAGAPVRARRLRLTPFALGATIRVTDSLQVGASRFYSEIMRLRRLVEMTKETMPLVFLLDELLHGTNSHDRRIGAEAVVKSLVERGALGLITTHDLALAHIAEVLAPRVANVHFEDHLENGRITFDYRLRPGVVRKSNALGLMRSVGLEV